MIQAGGEGYTVIDEPAVSGRRCRVSDSFARFLGASVAILAAIISCEVHTYVRGYNVIRVYT